MGAQPLVIAAIFACMVMLAGWFWQLRSSNAGIVDALWSFGIGATAVFYAATGEGDTITRIVVACISGFWFFRLGVHLLARVVSEPEDGRYQAIRRFFGRRTNVFHFLYFQAQALLVWVCALPMWVVANNPVKLSPVIIGAAVVIAVIAFAGETIADKQLARFRADPDNRGKTCRSGLWRYSRHPNYFFEWLHWFAYPLLALGAQSAVWVWLAPVGMFLFLYFITGIPYTEQQALRSRGDDYRDYQNTTSAFIPWRPKA
ncbi:MAG: DUF1295 domain-containing protein [Gammaproteobacteria bacterium]|nr:DUF1295 domain-containing protein [Gammaproteobacteria bacterium]